MSETLPRGRRWQAHAVAVLAAGLPLMLAGCGDDVEDCCAESGGAEQSEQTGFCADLERVVTAGTEVNEALFEGDAAALETAIEEYPARAATAAESAPPEIAEDLASIRDLSERLLDQIDGIDASDQQALEEAIAGVDVGPELDQAAGRVAEYSRTECGFDPAATIGG